MGGVGNVGVHNLSPGMVTTELLLSGAPPGPPRLPEAAARLFTAPSVHLRMTPNDPDVRELSLAVAQRQVLRLLQLPRCWSPPWWRAKLCGCVRLGRTRSRILCGSAHMVASCGRAWPASHCQPPCCERVHGACQQCSCGLAGERPDACPWRARRRHARRQVLHQLPGGDARDGGRAPGAAHPRRAARLAHARRRHQPGALAASVCVAGHVQWGASMLLASAGHQPGISRACPARYVPYVTGCESSLHARWCSLRATVRLCCSTALPSLVLPLLQSVSVALAHSRPGAAGLVRQVPDKDQGVQPDRHAPRHRRAEKPLCSRGLGRDAAESL